MSNREREMLQIAKKLGISMNEVEIETLRLNQLKIVDLLPEMLIMVRSLIAGETYLYKRNPIEVMNRGLLISFQNILERTEKEESQGVKELNSRPHVRITPSHVESEIVFPKDIPIEQITILVELDYLERFVGKDRDKLHYLFDTEKTFWIEEFISPEMAL